MEIGKRTPLGKSGAWLGAMPAFAQPPTKENTRKIDSKLLNGDISEDAFKLRMRGFN